MRTTPSLLVLLGLTSLLALTGCPPWGGDDDDDVIVDDDDDDTVADDDDSTDPVSIQMAGEVIARSAESGGILSFDEYQERSGLIVVYLLEDPDDISDVAWKSTMEGPGTFGGTLDANLGPLYATVIADCDGNAIIEDNDIRRSYAYNPLFAGITDISEVTLEIDVPTDCRGDGGGGGDDSPTTTISGPITLMNLDPAPIAVAIADEDMEHIGWWRFFDAGSPDYEISTRDWLGVAKVIAYHESDGNGLFEPADFTGEATSNPIQLGVGDVTGVEILIPSGEPLNFPQPPSPIDMSGTVAYADYAGGNILVFATANDTNGQLLAAQTLAAPGPFSLQVPEEFSGMMLWAVYDPEADGGYNLAVDANDLLGPFNTEDDDVAGLSLVLENVPSNVNSLGGTITVNADAGPNDRLVVYLLDNPTMGAPPVDTQYYGNPGATVEYSFVGLSSGSYLIVAFLDYDSDGGAGPSVDEPLGSTGEVVLSGGTNITDNDFGLVVP